MTTAQPSHRKARLEPADSRDDFPTPPWATRALIHHVLARLLSPGSMAVLNRATCWEPAANRCHMVRALEETFGPVMASDIQDYGDPRLQLVLDFLSPMPDFFRGDGGALGPLARRQDWIITNPPFNKWAEFALRCMDLEPRSGFALFGPSGLVHSIGRYRSIFSVNPPTAIAYFSEDVPLVRGRLDPKAGTQADYAWFVWLNGFKPHAPIWIPPCRRELERPGDYVEAEEGDEE